MILFLKLRDIYSIFTITRNETLLIQTFGNQSMLALILLLKISEINEEMRMDQSKASKFKKLLIQEKNRILKRFELNTKEEGFSKENFENSSLAKYIIKNEIINSIKIKEFEKLKAIEEALGRLEQGVYGFCEECDESIGENRLKIQPWTTLCISDAEELERQLQKKI